MAQRSALAAGVRTAVVLAVLVAFGVAMSAVVGLTTILSKTITGKRFPAQASSSSHTMQRSKGGTTTDQNAKGLRHASWRPGGSCFLAERPRDSLYLGTAFSSHLHFRFSDLPIRLLMLAQCTLFPDLTGFSSTTVCLTLQIRGCFGQCARDSPIWAPGNDKRTVRSSKLLVAGFCFFAVTRTLRTAS